MSIYILLAIIIIVAAIACERIWGQNADSKAEDAVQKQKPDVGRRSSIPCDFQDGFTVSEFEWMVKHARKKIHRNVQVSVHGAIVYGTFKAISGKSQWDFTLDFNDYGHITGRYWKETISESRIPDRLAELINEELEEWKTGTGRERYAQSRQSKMERSDSWETAENASQTRHADAYASSSLNDSADYWKGVFRDKRPDRGTSGQNQSVQANHTKEEVSYCINCGNKVGAEYNFCPECGAEIDRSFQWRSDESPSHIKYCPRCHNAMPQDSMYCLNCGESFFDSEEEFSDIVKRVRNTYGHWRNKWVALVLCIFLGWLGVHKFYEGKVVMGFIYLFTMGLFGLGWLCDIVILAMKPNPYLARKR